MVEVCLVPTVSDSSLFKKEEEKEEKKEREEVRKVFFKCHHQKVAGQHLLRRVLYSLN